MNVHNANLLGAAAVDAALGDDTGARERVARAVDRSLSHQAADGSWPYGEGGNLGWADSFHTGYVLLCLSRLRGIDPAVDDAIARGRAPLRAVLRRRRPREALGGPALARGRALRRHRA